MTQDNTPDVTNEAKNTNSTRRTFLKLGAVATVAAFGFGNVKAQQETISLDGETQGWQGMGETNPTLELEAGQTYVVEWTNADGQPHDFVVLDSNGNEIVGTDVVDSQGETTTLEFTASEEMAEYYCSIHPNTMRGEIQISGGDGGDEATTTDDEQEDETTTDDEQEDETTTDDEQEDETTTDDEQEDETTTDDEQEDEATTDDEQEDEATTTDEKKDEDCP